jgi:hypothetical protein
VKTVFLRALEAEDKAATLRTAIREPETTRGRQRFELDPRRFGQIRSAPFAYWASDQVLDLFVRFPALASAGRIARTTNPTTDDFRFARAWWEPGHSQSEARWRSWNKGGGFSPYYRDIDLIIDWDSERSTYRGYLGTIYRPDVRPANLDYFFRPGLTWGYRGHRLCVQAMPAGTVISTRGNGLYAEDALRLFDLGLLNSSTADSLIKLSLGRGGHPQFDIGDLSSIPVPPPDATVSGLASRAWSLKRSLDTRIEASHAFTLPAILQVGGDTLIARASAWAEHVRTIEAEFVAIQTEIDNCSFELYGIGEADRRAIVEGFGGGGDESSPTDEDDSEADADDESNAENSTDAAGLAAELVSWAVGVTFGRFDVRLATGERQLPAEPKLFDSLPVFSPAMLTGYERPPLTSKPAGYPIHIPENGILVDDLGHALDLVGAVRTVFDTVFGVRADAWWSDVSILLDPRNQNLRTWLATGFFEHHLKHHSKSRRRAPIMWQLGVPSSRYGVWLFAHRLTRDSFFQIQNDTVTFKLRHEQSLLSSLTHSAGVNPTAKDRKEIAAQEALVEELHSLLDEVKRVAPLWNPSLDDGVILTMAPLWRLVPQVKRWQRELKIKWDELVAGKYDWAQIAMHLWPERVVPKCSTNRSLAISHGLEDVFWIEGDDGEWKVRPIPTRPVDDLVRSRTSVAVKAALRSLLEAPVANSNGGQGRARRAANAASADGGER